MPIDGRPFLDYVLGSLADAGLRSVRPRRSGRVPIRYASHYANVTDAACRWTSSCSRKPRGTADAVLAAEGWAADAPFLALNADNLYPVQVLRDLAALDEPGLPGVRARGSGRVEQHPAGARPVVRAARGRRTRAAHADRREARRMPTCRRPGEPMLVSMNCWRFDAASSPRAATSRHRRGASSSCRLRSARGPARGPIPCGARARAGARFVASRRRSRSGAPPAPGRISRRDGRRHARRAARIRGPGRAGTRGEGAALRAHARSLAAGCRNGSCRGVVGAWTARGLRNAHRLRRRAIARRASPARVRVPGGGSSRSADPGHRCKGRQGSRGQEERCPPGVRRHLPGAVSCALPRLATLRRGDRRAARA